MTTSQDDPEPLIIQPSSTPLSVIFASVHQGHSQFGLHAGKQCSSNSLAFLLQAHLTEPNVPTDLDTVLQNGISIYQTTGQTGNLLTTDLPRTLFHQEKLFKINYLDSCKGNVHELTRPFLSPHPTLATALKMAYKATNYMLITLGDNPGVTLAIYGHLNPNIQYHVFDPHCRDSYGLPSSEGAAVLLKFRYREQLLAFLREYAAKLTRNPSSCPYELTPLKISVQPKRQSSRKGEGPQTVQVNNLSNLNICLT